MKKIIFIILILFALFILSAAFNGCNICGNKGAKDEITVVLIPKLTGNSFFDTAGESARTYAENHGFKVEYKGCPEADAEKQIKIVREAIKDKSDAICISAADYSEALNDVLKEAESAGIKVVTWESDVSGEARTVMVSHGTPKQLGELLVDMGAKCLEHRGKNIFKDKIKYVWHYSQDSAAEQQLWNEVGEKYIKEVYPEWENINPDNYYSEQSLGKALKTSSAIFSENPDIDLIICCGNAALPGQAQVARNLGLSAKDVSITGFSTPNIMREYCKDGTVERWAFWDCKLQGKLSCYLAYYIASGNKLTIGDKINVPEIGIVEIIPNTILDPDAYTSENSGVVLLPGRIIFTLDNIDKYNY